MTKLLLDESNSRCLHYSNTQFSKDSMITNQQRSPLPNSNSQEGDGTEQHRQANLDEYLGNPRLSRRVACIRHDMKGELRKCFLECPSGRYLRIHARRQPRIRVEEESRIQTGQTTSYRPWTTTVGICRLHAIRLCALERVRWTYILSISCESNSWPSRMNP